MVLSYTEFQNAISTFGGSLPWLLALTALSLYVVHKIVKGRRNSPAGPKGLVAFMDTIKALRNGRLHVLGEKWARQYGELVLCKTIVGNFCFLNSPQIVRAAYAGKATEHATNDRPALVGSFLYLGDMALQGPSSQANWAKLRKLLHSTLKFYGDGVERMESTVKKELSRLADSLASKLESSTKSDGGVSQNSLEVDMAKTISYSVQRVVICLFTGETPKADSELPALIAKFVETAEELLAPTTDFVLQVFPFLRYIPGTYYKTLCDKAFKARDAVLRELLDNAKATRVPGQPRGMLDVLLDEQGKEENDWVKDDNIRGVILDIVDGAYLTSRETIKGFFLYMVHNPKIMKNVQKEIDEQLGERPPSLEDRRSLPYTEAAILETLRFSSFAPLGFPHVTVQDVVIEGFCIPKGTVLFQNLWWINHDVSLWGDPEVFRPERFLDDKGQLLPVTHKIRQSFLPFGIGRRSCPGENFARSRVFLYVTTLLQKFDILPPVQHELLPMTSASWRDSAVLQLEAYHVMFRMRAR